jgi:hypothetical protein
MTIRLRENGMTLKWQETLVSDRGEASVSLRFVFKSHKYDGATILRYFHTESDAKRYFIDNFGESNDIKSAAIARFKGSLPPGHMMGHQVWDFPSRKFI